MLLYEEEREPANGSLRDPAGGALPSACETGAQRLIDAIPNPVLCFSSGGDIVLANAGARRLAESDSVFGELLRRAREHLKGCAGGEENFAIPDAWPYRVLVSRVNLPRYSFVVHVGHRDLRLRKLEKRLEEVSKREREFDSIFENSHDGLCFSDENGYPIRYNRSYCRILGVGPGEIVGVSQEEIVERGIVSESATLQAVKTRKPVTTLPVLKTDKKALITAQPIYDTGGKLIRVVANVRDITELMKLKEEMEAARSLSDRYYKELLLLRGSTLQPGMIAVSPNVREVRNKALKVAPTDVTVFVSGESGVGKEVLAKDIHSHSGRRDGPFIKINCASTPHSLMESEYFGYARGAFTSAASSGKVGLFSLAGKGTLFLDEIGELPLEMQCKLLAVLQDKKFLPVGGVAEVELNARIIAATNRNMEEMVREGTFRRDLYYRLNIVNLVVPPLRERREDILALTSFMVRKFNEEYRTANSLAPCFVKALEHYPWPGNVRELANLIEQMVALYPNENLQESHLPEHMRKHAGPPEVEAGSLAKMLDDFERSILENLLRQNLTSYQLAGRLGVNQSTAIRKLKKYDMLKRLKGNGGCKADEGEIRCRGGGP